MGATLSVIYSAECLAAQAASKKAARPAAILPLLVILFVVSYVILTMLVFEQGQTIESQRTLIREMLKDSTQLAAIKGKLARDDDKKAHDKASAADAKGAGASTPPPGGKVPDKESKRPGKSARSMKQIPGKPAADLEDVRRSTQVI